MSTVDLDKLAGVEFISCTASYDNICVVGESAASDYSSRIKLRIRDISIAHYCDWL